MRIKLETNIPSKLFILIKSLLKAPHNKIIIVKIINTKVSLFTNNSLNLFFK